MRKRWHHGKTTGGYLQWHPLFGLVGRRINLVRCLSRLDTIYSHFTQPRKQTPDPSRVYRHGRTPGSSDAQYHGDLAE
jgi:hypothetical protein